MAFTLLALPCVIWSCPLPVLLLTDSWICNEELKTPLRPLYKLLLTDHRAEDRRLSELWLCTQLFIHLVFTGKRSYKFAILTLYFVLWPRCYYDRDEWEICECVNTAMLPVLESAHETSLTVKRLETENSQLKAAIQQHEADAKRQGNTALAACWWSCIE